MEFCFAAAPCIHFVQMSKCFCIDESLLLYSSPCLALISFTFALCIGNVNRCHKQAEGPKSNTKREVLKILESPHTRCSHPVLLSYKMRHGTKRRQRAPQKEKLFTCKTRHDKQNTDCRCNR